MGWGEREDEEEKDGWAENRIAVRKAGKGGREGRMRWQAWEGDGQMSERRLTGLGGRCWLVAVQQHHVLGGGHGHEACRGLLAQVDQPHQQRGLPRARRRTCPMLDWVVAVDRA